MKINELSRAVAKHKDRNSQVRSHVHYIKPGRKSALCGTSARHGWAMCTEPATFVTCPNCARLALAMPN